MVVTLGDILKIEYPNLLYITFSGLILSQIEV